MDTNIVIIDIIEKENDLKITQFQDRRIYRRVDTVKGRFSMFYIFIIVF
jgi:hypothetical protein